MWQLLKDEVSYNNTAMISSVILIIQLFFYSISQFYTSINMVILLLYAIIIHSLIIERSKTGIDRQNSLLPFSNLTLGICRFLLFISPCLILIVELYFINLILFPSAFDEVLTLIGQLGFILILAGSFVIVQDIYFSYSAHNSAAKLFIMLIYFVVLLSSTVFAMMIADIIDPKFSAGYGIYFIYIWGFIINGFTIVSFAKRRFYL